MTVTTTCTETDLVQDRLAPIVGAAQKPFPPGGRTLLRTGSFNVLRQFPAYLCSRGSSKDIVHWLYESRTKISSAIALWHKEAHRALLVLSIWSCLLLITCQAVWMSVYILTSTPLPWGFIFLVTCLIATATMATTVISPPTKRRR